MSVVAAAVYVFWGCVVLALGRMWLTYRRSNDVDEKLAYLRELVAAADLKVGKLSTELTPRIESLEAGQLSLNNKVESAKVTPMRSRRGWG